MKFTPWNVNGLRARVKKGFEASFHHLDADLLCLQETKMQAGQLDLQFGGYQSYWNHADKKGYSSTAIYIKHIPLNVAYGLGIDEHDHEGRVIVMEMDDFLPITVYVPNSQGELRRLDYRTQWRDDLRAYIMQLDAIELVIIRGDLNVTHEEIDLKGPKTNRRNAGFIDEEREKMTVLFNNGFVDTFRHLYPEQVTCSWWSYRFRAREKSAGWRIDYSLISGRLKERLVNIKIHTETLGSDYYPVELELL